MGFQIDRRVGQMRPLAEPGVGRRHQPMPGRAISGCIFLHAHPADHAPWQTRKVAAMMFLVGDGETKSIGTIRPVRGLM